MEKELVVKVDRNIKEKTKNFGECYDIFKEGLSGFVWKLGMILLSMWMVEIEFSEPLIRAMLHTQYFHNNIELIGFY